MASRTKSSPVPSAGKRPSDSSRRSASRGGRRRTILVALCLATATFIAFLPALDNAFLNWDDDELILRNPHIRGLGAGNLKWMFTTFYFGPYMPVTWVSYALDYSLWETDPFGYHLTNLLLHAANAALFYLLAVMLLRSAMPAPSDSSRTRLRLSAAFAALLFAVHPLRVESVAWATERRDVLSGLFFLLTLLAYLAAQESAPRAGRRRLWLATSLGVYALALLSKGITMTLPVVLVILDVTPLRRLRGGPAGWFRKGTGAVWAEKAPYLVLAVAAAALALIGQRREAALAAVAQFGATERLALAAHSAAFYLFKTIVPRALLPLYELPRPLDSFAARFLIAAGFCVVLTAVLLALSRRWIAGLAAWAAYLVLLAPVSGLAQAGPQIAADRYTYLPGMVLALAGGALLLYALHLGQSARIGRRALGVGVAAGVAIAVTLGVVTWRQTYVWRNSVTLWSHVIEHEPRSFFGHVNLGRAFADADDLAAAVEEFRTAMRIAPDHPMPHYNLANAYRRAGKLDRAVTAYKEAIRLDPDDAKIHYNLAVTYLAANRFEPAIDALKKTVTLTPRDAAAHYNLGMALRATGQHDLAEKHLGRARDLGFTPGNRR